VHYEPLGAAEDSDGIVYKLFKEQPQVFVAFRGGHQTTIGHRNQHLFGLLPLSLAQSTDTRNALSRRVVGVESSQA
jgi:hypothetical protein